MDEKLSKERLRKNIKDRNNQLKVDEKDKLKIMNIMNDTFTRAGCKVKQDEIKPYLRRYLENSDGDNIFHRDNINKYMAETLV